MEFRIIPDTDGMYLVSRTGIIQSRHKLKFTSLKAINISTHKTVSGYTMFGVTLKGKRKSMYVHRAVALAFIPNPESKPQVNHIDGNKSNNYYKNLEWSTAKENIRHAVNNGLFHDRDTHPKCKINRADVADIMKSYTGKRGEQSRIAEKYGVHRVCIQGIIKQNKNKSI